MEDLSREIAEIRRLIQSAALVSAVRSEVSRIVRGDFVVTDGKHHPSAEEYEVVVRCGENQRSDVARRIRSSISDIEVERIADGVLGIKTARRGSYDA